MSGFGEEPLATPVVVSRTSDRCRPTRLDIRANEKLVRIEFEKGEGTGQAFNPHGTDNITIENLTNEDGTPGVQEWDILISGTEIAQWCRAQPGAVSNGAVLAKFAMFILDRKGVI